LELAFTFARTEPRRARKSLVGPLAPALDHRTGNGLMGHGPGGVPRCPGIVIATEVLEQDQRWTRRWSPSVQ
jgi:hypothetical protein